jgi:hypothetical protein
MRHPAVVRRAVPVFDFGRYFDRIAGEQNTRGLTPCLIPAAPGSHQKDLAAFVVDMPVIPAAGFKRNVRNVERFRQGIQIGLPAEVAGILFRKRRTLKNKF